MSLHNRISCNFCTRIYFYLGAYFTHLRDKHGERVEYVPRELLPNEGFLLERDHILLPHTPRPTVLPPDSEDEVDDTENNEESNNHDINSEEIAENQCIDDWNAIPNEDYSMPDAIPPPVVAHIETPTEREPGKVVEGGLDLLDVETTQLNDWAPFDNEKEFRFAEWVVKHRISKTAVDELLKSPAFGGNHTFTSAYSLFKKLDNMVYELGMHTWKTGKVSFNRSDTGNRISTTAYTSFYYRNPVTCIEFLLRQSAYKEHMTYAPVREYNDENERVYSELHTGDWWWRMQVLQLL